MAKPPNDMSTLWVRDENKDMRERVKQGARMKGQKSADFLRQIIEDALEDTEASFLGKRDRKTGQSERCNGHDN